MSSLVCEPCWMKSSVRHLAILALFLSRLELHQALTSAFLTFWWPSLSNICARALMEEGGNEPSLPHFCFLFNRSFCCDPSASTHFSGIGKVANGVSSFCLLYQMNRNSYMGVYSMGRNFYSIIILSKGWRDSLWFGHAYKGIKNLSCDTKATMINEFYVMQ